MDINFYFILPAKFLLTNGRLNPSNGVILFSGNYHTRPNTYIIRANGKDLRIEDFRVDQIKGSGNFKAMFQGNLNNALKIYENGEKVKR